MKHSLKFSPLIIFVLAITACQRSELHMEVETRGDKLEIVLTNQLSEPLAHSATVYSGLLAPDQDLILVFERDSRLHAQCVRLDQVPMGRDSLAVDATLRFSATLSQLSSLYCLEPGEKYFLRAALLERDGQAYRIVALSNRHPVVAVAGWRGHPSTSMSVSTDGRHIEYGPPVGR